MCSPLKSVALAIAGMKGHRAGDQSPGEHDARDPAPRADAIEREIGRHLQHEIGEEEHAGAEAEHRVGDADVGVHRQLGEADVDPVEIGDEVAKHQKRHETPGDLAP